MTNISPNAPKSLAHFQTQYGQYLRSPKTHARPNNIPARASQVYEDLFFNNICGFINSCFPVAKTLFTQEQWTEISRAFFNDWRCHTPYFSEISKEFVQYIQTYEHNLILPPWFAELIEYEWLELDVDTNNAVALRAQPPTIKAGNKPLYANPSLRNKSFEWPVHRIGKSFIPEAPEATFLAIYRDTHHRVQFMAMNAMTSALLDIFVTQPCTAQDALEQLAAAINHPNTEQIIAFGLPIIEDFMQRNMLVSA